jgi:hypothetical protein
LPTASRHTYSAASSRRAVGGDVERTMRGEVEFNDADLAR